jgi:hypothetical protein
MNYVFHKAIIDGAKQVRLKEHLILQEGFQVHGDLAILGVCNLTFMGYTTSAILPFFQALKCFPVAPKESF